MKRVRRQVVVVETFLPNEMWLEILLYLDFHTIFRKLALVSHYIYELCGSNVIQVERFRRFEKGSLKSQQTDVLIKRKRFVKQMHSIHGQNCIVLYEPLRITIFGKYPSAYYSKSKVKEMWRERKTKIHFIQNKIVKVCKKENILSPSIMVIKCGQTAGCMHHGLRYGRCYLNPYFKKNIERCFKKNDLKAQIHFIPSDRRNSTCRRDVGGALRGIGIYPGTHFLIIQNCFQSESDWKIWHRYLIPAIFMDVGNQKLKGIFIVLCK